MYTRITNQTLLRGYRREYNRILSQKNALERKVTSTRDFNRASEAPLKAAKALNVRKSMYYSDQYKENLKTANKFYTEGETSLLQVSDKLANIRETIIAAVNTTKDVIDYNIYAQQLETSAQELCNIFNTDSAERVIFGGSSNDPMPLQIINDSNGNPSTVTYQGVPVNCYNDYKQFPYSDVVCLDIGIGMVTDQDSHVTNPNTMLNISFNGAKVSGCGAESGTADVDLTSIKENGTYCVDVYAGNIKHTIAFRGKATPEENVDEINRQLAEAFKKDVAYKKLDEVPRMDDQGVIAIKDKVVAVVNNTAKDVSKVKLAPGTEPLSSARVRELGVDNDAGYTDKFKVNLGNLKEGQEYSLKVTVGDVTKTINFVAGKDIADGDNLVEREDVSAANIQAALDAAFPDEKVTISNDELTRGIITCEGKRVKITAGSDEEEVKDKGAMVSVTSSSTPKIDLGTLREGRAYAVNVTYNNSTYTIQFKAGDTESKTKSAIQEALNDKFKAPNALTVDNNGVIKAGDGSAATLSKASGDELNTTAEQGSAENPYAVPIRNNTVNIDKMGNLKDGKEYFLTINGQDITFEAEDTKDKNLDAIKEKIEALEDADGNKLYTFNKTDGTITFKDTAKTDKITLTAKSNDQIKANAIVPTATTNYTIDTSSLKGGQKYSVKVVYDGQVRNIEFTPEGDGNLDALNTALASAFGTTGTPAEGIVKVDNTGALTAGAEIINNTTSDTESVYGRQTIYSNNYIQLTLDAAKALRNGDINYANGCIDRIVKANENLLAEIADLGCNEEYIDFNLTRITTRVENLQERQNDLEIADPEQTIMLWKQFEAMYNACLQMSSQVVPNSIFNYIK